MAKQTTFLLAKLLVFSFFGLFLICLLVWQSPLVQADTVSEGGKKLTCSQSSEKFKNVEYYNGGTVCGGDVNTGCQCANNGDLIYKLDQYGNEWIKGNEEVGGSRFRGLGGNIFWIMNGASETNNRVLGWNSSSYAENDVYLQDNLIMYGRHIENQSDLGLFINMFSDKPVQVGGGGDAQFITSGSLLVDPRDNWLIAPNGQQQYKYQHIQHSQASSSEPVGNVAVDNDVRFSAGDAYLAGQVHLGGDGYDGTYVSGLMFYPWQYYMEDPRSASNVDNYQNYDNKEQYQEKWRKRMAPLDKNNNGVIDGYDAVINGFATFVEASDYFKDNCAGLVAGKESCLDSLPSYDKDTRGSFPNSNQLLPIGDDRVDLRMYLANGKDSFNRFSIWSWQPPIGGSKFYDSVFSTDASDQLQHAFYGDGLAYHQSGVIFNPLAKAPAQSEGTVYYSSASHELKYFDGSLWKSIGQGGQAGDFTNCTYIKMDSANQDGKRNIDCSNLPLDSGYVMQGICLSESGQKQCYNSDLGMVWGFVKCCKQ